VSHRVEIHKLPSGVPGLDEVLGGGIPELSFNLIAGGPGGGKTRSPSRSCLPTRSRSGLRCS
jgi:predicted ATP-dependent serine protease